MQEEGVYIYLGKFLIYPETVEILDPYDKNS